MRIFAFLAPVSLAMSLALGACSGDDGGDCDPDLIDTACTPQYEPTWDNIFANTITPNCAPPGTACHASEGNRAGLTLEDIDESFSRLKGAAIVDGDACASQLAFRVTSVSPIVQMPPGAPLDAGEQCAIIQWIEDGAQR